MKPLKVEDALCPDCQVARVRADQRPSAQRLVGTFHAVFDGDPQHGDGLGGFLGLVTERDIAMFPQRIFADLIAPHTPPPLAADLPLELAYGNACDMVYGEDLPLPVVDGGGRFLGVVTRNSALAALFRQQGQLLQETAKLNDLLVQDRDQLAAWSARLADLHQASRTLLGLLSHTTLHTDLLQGGIDALAQLLQAKYGAIGILGPENQLQQFVHTGIDADTAAKIGQPPTGKGLLGVVVNENQALRLADLRQDPRSAGFPAHHPPMRSLLAVPVAHLHHVYGRIYLCDKLDGSLFTPEDELLALSFAHSLSLILDNARELEEIRQAQRRLDFFAHYDSLTGLPNRTLFLDRLQQAIAYASRNNCMVGLLFLDIDNFKFINDTLGHAAGDQLLKGVGDRMRNCIRGNDTAARLGGDEFTAIVTDIHDGQQAMVVANKLLEAIAQPFVLGGQQSYVTASIGIALYPGDGDCVELLLQHADTAMYHAKSMGKNTGQFYAPDMNVRAKQRLQMEHHLRRALENGEFSLCYQPQFNLADGRIHCLEALLRWHCPQLGQVPPAEFIPIAEETCLINPICAWVLEAACRQARRWQQQGHGRLRVAVNLSPLQFRNKNLVQKVADTLNKTGLAAEHLELEITEGVLMQNTEHTVAVMKALKELGVRFAVDDFGTGYSSLSYLKRFPIAALKIDQSFVRDVADDSDSAAIVTAIIAMAAQLKLATVAEGVETPAQLEFLRAHGCQCAQGYLLGRPATAEQIGQLLAAAGLSAVAP